MSQKEPTHRLEMWGGAECTINRVGNHYFDQLERVAHRTRLTDIERFVDLGIRTLRFPILWEHMQPEEQTAISWEWPDRALSLLRQRHVRPILGLLHHGYGPSWTGFLDPDFATRFAQYASRVATRYPWVDAYTPINEPLTTARFSGLYGHWYPHTRDVRTFAQIFLAQCRATVLAMRAIREVNPAAKLIQTEDLGKVESTSMLSYQRDFENERRWLTWDILTGQVNASHPMWRYLRSLGISEQELSAFVESPCPPDILGVNYYVTSERFLDDRIDRYPSDNIGGNGRDKYADVAGVHVPDASPIGVEGILREAWQRYQCAIAVTECHIGCTREEQMRWFHETWNAATKLRDEEHVDIHAVTSWALLGSYDWNSLVTQPQNHYETGAFDIRAPVPRPTAIASMIEAFAHTGTYTHPVLSKAGWWHREAKSSSGLRTHSLLSSESYTDVLIIGATGTLGRALARVCEMRGLSYKLTGRPYIDIADQHAVTQALAHYKPWVVINAAGYVDVDRAEIDRARCTRANTLGPATLAAVCAARGIRLVTYSSDLVFDGCKGSAYVESDVTNPCNVYGYTKATAEQLVREIAPQSLIIRTSAFFGPWDQHNLVIRAIQAVQTGLEFEVPSDITVTPTYVPDLANATLDLVLDGEQGLWHLSNGTPITWYDFVCAAARHLALPTSSLVACPGQSMGFTATRPINSALASEMGWIMPTLDDALRRFASDIADVTTMTMHPVSQQTPETTVEEHDQQAAFTY